jgi:hypothetical protein
MSRWLPPGGGGYSGRSATTGRFISKASASRASQTSVRASASTGGSKTSADARSVRVTPQGKGSAGVSRAK